MKKGEGEQISVVIPKEMLIEMDNMVEKCLFSSRASIVRRALTEFLDKAKILS